MEEMRLLDALLAGEEVAHKRGLVFSPNKTKLTHELSNTKGKAGTLILPEGRANYRLINIEQHKIPIAQVETESTAEELWECVKEHYGINALTALTASGAIPIPKPWMGRFVTEGASYFTNPISEFGTRFYPLRKLRHGTQLARSAKAVFGTTRIFGLIGRANIVGFIGFAIFDVITLSICMNKKG